MLFLTDDGIREPDVREAGLGEHLSLARFRHGEPLSAEPSLPPRDSDRLVRLDVRAECDPLGGGLGLHPL